jgi:hypothetical protein
VEEIKKMKEDFDNERLNIILENEQKYKEKLEKEKKIIKEAIERNNNDDEEKKNLKELLQKEVDKKKCIICEENDINILIYQCGHSLLCEDCSKLIKNCPYCYGDIDKLIKIYFR